MAVNSFGSLRFGIAHGNRIHVCLVLAGDRDARGKGSFALRRENGDADALPDLVAEKLFATGEGKGQGRKQERTSRRPTARP